jgi:Fe2+ or Zn2+ uptake regulation protein
MAIQLRNPRQKEAVRRAFVDVPEEVLSTAQTGIEAISIATIYRTLVEDGWLARVERGERNVALENSVKLTKALRVPSKSLFKDHSFGMKVDTGVRPVGGRT